MSGFYKLIQDKGYYIIAEIGVNYYDIACKEDISLMDAAKLMIKEAKLAGLDAVKFQSYKAETLASKYSPSYWDNNEEPTKSQYDLFKKFDLFGESEYIELANYCKKLNIDFMSTPFDLDSIEYLDKLLEIYKISSSDITNYPFMKEIVSKKKPIAFSTGASDIEEISKASEIISKNKKRNIMMHCILEYPTPNKHANLSRIKTLNELFGKDFIIGYSDHTRPDENMDILVTAWLLGAKVIEKHFTLDKSLTGNDHYHAMDTSDAKKLIKRLEFVKEILGSKEIKCLDTEKLSRLNARRSIVLKRDLKEEEEIKLDDIILKRPGNGISPKDLSKVVGKRVKRDLPNDHILQYEDLIN